MLAAESSTSAEAPQKSSREAPCPSNRGHAVDVQRDRQPAEDSVDQAPRREDAEIHRIAPCQHPKPHTRHQRQNQWTSHIEDRPEEGVENREYRVCDWV